MDVRRIWTELVFGKVSLAVATAAIAVAGTVVDSKSSRIWIVGSCGLFAVISTAVIARRDRSIVRRLGREYDQVQGRGVQVIADLGQLVAGRYDLWMVDLYLPNIEWSIHYQWPFLTRKKVLSRQLTVSLVDRRPQPPSVESLSGPHWKSFSDAQPLVWINEIIQESSPNNAWDRFDEATNAQLALDYGVLSVFPLVDRLGKGCVGVLAVHVKPEPDTVLKAAGALHSDLGRREITDACADLKGLLSR